MLKGEWGREYRYQYRGMYGDYTGIIIIEIHSLNPKPHYKDTHPHSPLSTSKIMLGWSLELLKLALKRKGFGFWV